MENDIKWNIIIKRLTTTIKNETHPSDSNKAQNKTKQKAQKRNRTRQRNKIKQQNKQNTPEHKTKLS